MEAAVFPPRDKDAQTDQFILTVGGINAQRWVAKTGIERTLYSPHDIVSAADYSPDGNFIVTASLDNTARIWDTDSVKSKFILAGHSSDVNDVEFSPDGKTVLTASRDKTAKLWDAETGKVIRTLKGHTGPVRNAVFSEDGTRVATASDDGTVRIWNVDDGAVLAEINCGRGAVLCVAFSSDGSRVISGTDEQDKVSGAYAKIWALEEEADGTLSHREILYLTGHTAAVTSVAFSPDEDGSRALTGSEDYIAKLWDTRTEADIAELAGRTESIEKPLPVEQQPPVDAPNPADVFAALAVKPVMPAKEILSLAGHLREVTTVAFSRDGKRGFDVLTGSRDGKAILWLTTGDWKVKAPTVKAAGAKPAAAGTVTASK